MKKLSYAALWLSLSAGVTMGFAACGGGDDSSSGPGLGSDVDSGATGDETGFNLDGAPTGEDFVSYAVEPATAVLSVDDMVPTTQLFKLRGTKKDGSTAEVTDGVTWSATNPSVGSIAGGTFTANGQLGGVVQITASHKGKAATASLTVKLRTKFDAATADDTQKASLRKADAPDGAVKWAYPYDDTVFPRGLAGPTLMWNGGAAGDDLRVYLSSSTFEFEGFIKPGLPARYEIPQKIWQKFVESTAGNASLVVQRLSGTTATKITDLKWKVAPASMRGTIYYWSNREGRVLRIKPGADKPDDFSASAIKPSETIEGQAVNCTMTCHRVSADGSTLISGGDVFGGSYDLGTNKPRYSFTDATFAARRQWHFGAPTPNGKYMVRNGNGDGGLFKTADATMVPATGLEKVPTWYPAFTPTGKNLLYVDYTTAGMNGLWSMDFDEATLKFGAKRLLVDANAVSTNKQIGYPSGSPDGKYVIYQRATVNGDTRGQCIAGEPTCRYDNRADLYLSPATDKGVEIALDKLNGKGYPFAAGSRDYSWNFEPTFAPVAAGGYYWVVFTSRRNYGNMYQGALAEAPQVKQLWVVAIDSTIEPGKDPSHAAFRLPGQSLTFVDGGGGTQNALNMTGNWALEPCKTDGTTCSAGSDCCGGFCEKKEGETAGSCKSAPPPCSAEGDKCSSDADCCGKAEGTRCLGGFCAQKPPA